MLHEALPPHHGADFARIEVHPRSTDRIQAKLAVGSTGDHCEQEADRVAEQVMRTPNPAAAGDPVSAPTTMFVKRQVDQGRGGDGIGEAPLAVGAVLSSPGRPLDEAARAYMEPRFGCDFSQVRVHDDDRAAQSARDVNALAYTAGRHVVFGAGRFAPETEAGRRLLAHELTHVVQQDHFGAAGRLSPVRRSPGPQAPPAPSPPAYLGSLGAGATHLEGDIWEVQISGLGRVPVGPHDQMQAYLGRFNQTRPANVERMESAHIVGGEHMSDLGWNTPYEKAPAIGVAKSLHKQWTRQTSHLQSKEGVGGGRATRKLDRAPTGPKDVMSLYHDVYRGIPSLQKMAGRIINLESPSIGPTSQPGRVAVTSVTAREGAPLQPVNEATPGFNAGAGAALGGGIQSLQAKQVGNLQSDEIDKYQEQLALLQPKIDGFLEAGYEVELILIVERPNSIDLLGGVYRDQGQIIYFRDLAINRVTDMKGPAMPSPRASSTQTSMGPTGGRDGFMPYPHQGGSHIDESKIKDLKPEHADHHCEYSKEMRYPERSAVTFEAPRRPTQQPVKARPQLDMATKQAMALVPSRVHFLSGNIIQYRKVVEIRKMLAGNASFVVGKEEMGWGNRKHTLVSYFSYLDKARAEALVEILRSGGIGTAYARLSGDGGDAPGTLQIMFGADAVP